MRITPEQKQAIVEVVHGVDLMAKVYLFGSRVRDDLKGGDIDLLVISESITFAQKLDILVGVKLRIGEQKIDLKIVTGDQAAEDPFVQSILPSAILLELK